ncbi:hypothetical protein HY641_00345 [Candidatus Woesearchaeota archaeon]|nr:hypothetical protein [Candidatus Woesearchaeota archaeon]
MGTNHMAKRSVLLISGGIDSPVAGAMMKRLEYELIALHLSQEPLTDDAAERKSIELAKKIGCVKFITLKYGHQLAEISKNCNHRLFFILQKRLMLRLAERIARDEGASAIITGESLGQVGSQTLSNLATISTATTLPILRPLLCLNKQEIIARARELDTYNTSKGPEICNLLGPKHPATTSRLAFVEAEEAKIAVDNLITHIIPTMIDRPL